MANVSFFYSSGNEFSPILFFYSAVVRVEILLEMHFLKLFNTFFKKFILALIFNPVWVSFFFILAVDSGWFFQYIFFNFGDSFNQNFCFFNLARAVQWFSVENLYFNPDVGHSINLFLVFSSILAFDLCFLIFYWFFLIFFHPFFSGSFLFFIPVQSSALMFSFWIIFNPVFGLNSLIQKLVGNAFNSFKWDYSIKNLAFS